jgi:hypothetical protein
MAPWGVEKASSDLKIGKPTIILWKNWEKWGKSHEINV